MRVICNLSCPRTHDTSALPKALYDLYLRPDSGEIMSLVDEGRITVSPTEITCIVSSKRADVTAWLDVLLELYPDIDPEVNIIKRHIRSEFIRSPLTDTFNVRLKEIKRQHGHNGALLQREWFWKPEEEKVSP